MVPKGWIYSTLEGLIDIKHGFAFKSEHFTNQGKFVLLTPGHFNESGGFRDQQDKTKYYNGVIPDGYLLTRGDLLLAMTEQAAGLLGSAAHIPEDNKYLHNQRLGLVKVLNPDKIDPHFLFWLYNSSQVRKQIAEQASGTKVKHTSPGKLIAISVLIPPVAEQTKIAKILSTWDKAIATTERLLANSQQQKKALMQQLLTGQKRFAESHEEWRVANFSSLYLVKNDKKTQTTSSNYLEHGKSPIVDQGQTLIAGYTDSNQLYRDVPVIVFGDHTRAIKWVDFEFSPGADGTQILKASDLLEARFAYYLLSNSDIPNLGYSRHMRELKEIDFRYPTDKVEQQKIAQVLSTADAEIANLQAQLDKLKLEKKALMQQLLTGKRRVRLDDEEEDVAPIRRVG